MTSALDNLTRDLLSVDIRLRPSLRFAGSASANCPSLPMTLTPRGATIVMKL
jgi:hypothetical protein